MSKLISSGLGTSKIDSDDSKVYTIFKQFLNFLPPKYTCGQLTNIGCYELVVEM